MRNSDVSKVEGKNKVVLKWTSEKEFTLNDVLHVPDIPRNLIPDQSLVRRALE